ncbi:unnamed protein product [Symbiodinium natans]|uniref:Uncharacterized protein n=1 Tax=Symbiodinium natans TaxID=878477 RepID=A0A812JYN8_9DINO|nr:unnamed protein product [Symbiodinium natans]
MDVKTVSDLLAWTSEENYEVVLYQLPAALSLLSDLSRPYFLPRVLSEHGHEDQALRIRVKTMFPMPWVSFGHQSDSSDTITGKKCQTMLLAHTIWKNKDSWAFLRQTSLCEATKSATVVVVHFSVPCNKGTAMELSFASDVDANTVFEGKTLKLQDWFPTSALLQSDSTGYICMSLVRHSIVMSLSLCIGANMWCDKEKPSMGSETIKKMKDVNASLHRCLENWISDGGCNSKTEQKMQKYDKDELHEQSRSGAARPSSASSSNVKEASDAVMAGSHEVDPPVLVSQKRQRLQDAIAYLDRMKPANQSALFMDGARKKVRVIDSGLETVASFLTPGSTMLTKTKRDVRQMTLGETSRLHGCCLDFSLCKPSYSSHTLANMASVPTAATMLLLACQTMALVKENDM